MTATQIQVSGWLEAVGAATGVALSLDADGHCNIIFGQQLECMVEVPEESTAVFLYVALKRAPDDPEARIACLEQALELNVFSLATGGATVAYDRRTGQIVLTFTREVERMDEERFKAVLGDVLDVAIDLHDKLDEIPAPAEPTPTETPPPWGLRL
jgi:hypothetical protein